MYLNFMDLNFICQIMHIEVWWSVTGWVILSQCDKPPCLSNTSHTDLPLQPCSFLFWNVWWDEALVSVDAFFFFSTGELIFQSQHCTLLTDTFWNSLSLHIRCSFSFLVFKSTPAFSSIWGNLNDVCWFYAVIILFLEYCCCFFYHILIL